MAQQVPTTDRRRVERRTPGNLSLVDLRSGGQRHRGILVDTGEGGLCAIPLSGLRRGSIQSVEFRLPGSHRRVAAKTQKAWTDGYSRLGLKFIDADHALQSEVRKWLLKPRRPSTRDSYVARSESTEHLESVLELLAQEAAVRTGATGVAIAVGSRTGMRCAGSVGSAPSVGAELSPEAGVSGRCLRTGEVVLCVDTCTAHDADMESAQELGIRSLLIIPIFSHRQLIAVLELLSEGSRAFGVQDLRRLEMIVDLIAEAVEASDKSATETGRASPSPESVELVSETPQRNDAVNREPNLPQPHWAKSRSRMVEILGISTLLIGTVTTATYVTQQWRQRRDGVRAAQPTHVAVPTQVNPGNSHPRVYFAAAKTTQKIGSPFFVTVKMDGAENVASVPIQIRYDPKRLQLMGVSGGDLLAGDGRNVAIVHRDDPASGTIQVTASRSPEMPGRSGNGVLFVLMFMAKSPGRSTLKVEQGAAKNPAMQTISVDSSQAKMTVVTS